MSALQNVLQARKTLRIKARKIPSTICTTESYKSESGRSRVHTRGRPPYRNTPVSERPLSPRNPDSQ